MPESSGVSITEHLHAFHKRHYSAMNMRLAVVGRNDLDQLQAWAIKFFSGIPSRPLHQRVPNPVPFAGDDSVPIFQVNHCVNAVYFATVFAIILYVRLILPPLLLFMITALIIPIARVIPVDGIPQLNISRSMPESLTSWRNKPYRLLACCLGHEGPGSVLALLKSRGWASELTAGLLHVLRDFSIFQCNITLTTEGCKNWREILHLVHRYLDIMKNASIPECAALFAECILVDDATFKFQEKQTGETLVQLASIALLDYLLSFATMHLFAF